MSTKKSGKALGNRAFPLFHFLGVYQMSTKGTFSLEKRPFLFALSGLSSPFLLCKGRYTGLSVPKSPQNLKNAGDFQEITPKKFKEESRMRNLKRALSLALASVMVMGLMVVGSGASYVDVSSEQNQEAIEVLQKVGVMTGDENGKFNPDANVTRNEMAVIMSNMLDYKVSNYAGTAPFTDVPSWAEPYVAACYTHGIISGYDAKTFGGSDSVTAAQAALMMMKALGYFQYQSDFGEDWQMATIREANKIDLYKDVNATAVAPMTRNDVAQLALNTLKSYQVEADNDTINVNGNGVSVSGGSVKY